MDPRVRHRAHPERCGCCSFCQHPERRHRRAGACRVLGCECVGWRKQLLLDPADPSDRALILELVDRDLV